ncbi:MAG: glycosyltransferase [Deltaproteobacteria bacterium]|nr:glycosyltransferase [Deltaproteobacteria bacterium]
MNIGRQTATSSTRSPKARSRLVEGCHDESMAIAFLGPVLPEDMCNRTPACNVSGNKLQINFLNALRKASGVSPTIVSFLPIGMFTKSRKLFVRSGPLSFNNGLRGRLIPFINVLFLKQLTIGLVSLLILMNWHWQNRRTRRLVLVYNVYLPMSLPVLLATKLSGGKAVAFVADFPHNLSFNFQGWKGMLQRINLWLESLSLAHFTGIIPLTQSVGEDFAPGRPMMVMEGGVDPDDVGAKSHPVEVPSAERICLFSGTLNEINGIDLLLRAFRLIPDPNFRLWIFGKGPLEAEVRAATQQDDRIVYRDFLPNAEVLRYQRQATVLLNARPTNQLITRYTFPSKLIEYMLSGRPVITTALSGIPKDYFDFIYVLFDETPEGLSRLLIDVCAKPAFELYELGGRAQEFILQTKNWSIQGRRVYEFICNGI